MRALIVDDDADIRDVARLSLELIGGWTVSAADCGSEAIDQALTFSPDVILLDVMMPGFDGLATMARFSDNPGTRDVPVIFLTASAQIGDRRRLAEAGARGVIAKPFDPLSLSRDVEAILSVRR